MRHPPDLRYATSHEWVRVRGDTATVGITEFAIKELTDLTYVELPEVGAEAKKGEPFGEIESVKAVSDLNSPVSGKVTAVNSDLGRNIEALGEDAYGKGWMVEIKMNDPKEALGLMTSAEYEKHIAE